MSNLGIKTPVSRLQEYLVSQNKIPHYELIHNGVGTHNPEFTFRVQVEGLSEEGTGKSKQEAKHRAAEKMLRSLKIVNPKEEEECEGNLEPAENYVGQLKNLCISLRFPEPNYYLEESSGPAHSRTFKMVCCVSQQKDFGIGRTKKQAKHQAALAMLQRFKEVDSNDPIESPDDTKGPEQIVPASMTAEEIFEKFNEVKSTDVTSDKDPAALYKDHHNAYVCLPKMSPTLSQVVKENKIIHNENSLTLIKDIATELGVQLSKVEIPSKVTDINFIILTLAVTPPASGVGFNESGAAFNLLNSFLVLCQ